MTKFNILIFKLWQTNKLFFIIGLLFFLTSLYAGKKFHRIGTYSNVEILKVTEKGIYISHSEGICYITENDLSDGQKKLLSAEIEQYHKLKSSHIAHVKKLRKQQTEQLETLITQIPKMTWKELLHWGKTNTGFYLSSRQFWTNFDSAFKYAENRIECKKYLVKESNRIYQEYECKKVERMSVNDLYAWLQKHKLNYLNTEDIRKKFNLASNREKAVLTIEKNKDKLANLIRQEAERREAKRREAKRREEERREEERKAAERREAKRRAAERREAKRREVERRVAEILSRENARRRCGACRGIGVVNNVVVNGQYRNWYGCPACNGRGKF